MHNVYFCGEARLHIELSQVSTHGGSIRLCPYLCEFGLAIGPQILVSETPRELKVFLNAGCHENLLVLLGTLRQRICQAFISGWHKKLPSTFRCGLEQKGCLELSILIVVEDVPRYFRGACSEQ